MADVIRPVAAIEHEVAAHATPTAPSAIRAALAKAYKAEVGHAPSAETLDVLTAHVSHETGRGAKMYNFNFGGIKGQAPDGGVAKYGTREVKADGTDIHITDGFRAYSDLNAGAKDYVRFMKTRFSSALDAAGHGDVGGFAAALKQKGYFTEQLDPYQKSLTALVGEEHRTGGIAMGAISASSSSSSSPSSNGVAHASDIYDEDQDPAAFPTALEVARVLDAVAAMGAQISAPIDQAKS